MTRRSRGRRANRAVVHQGEVNLTPLIDTALTLLVIFMMTTPLLQNSIKIELPQGQAQEAGTAQQEIVVTLQDDKHMFFNNKPVTLATLGPTLKAHLAQLPESQRSDKRVWVKVDKKACSADSLITVIDCIKVVGGVKDVAIATERKGA